MFENSWDERVRLMDFARCSIEDSMVELYTCGEFDPVTRHITLFDKYLDEPHWNLWLTPKKQRRLMIEAVLRILESLVCLATLAEVNPFWSARYSFSDWGIDA